MSFLNNVLKGAKVALDLLEKKANEQAYQQARSSGVRIGGYSLSEWDRQWQRIGILNSLHLTPFNKDVGLYRATLHGRIVYIGRAVEWNNGGFRKRLSDYTRESTSARKHRSGQLMNQHSHELMIDIVITGSGPEAAETARKLEKVMIGKYNPPWNVQK